MAGTCHLALDEVEVYGADDPARNIAVVRSSQVVIAIGGAYGTLAEMAFALNSGIPVTPNLAEQYFRLRNN